METAPDSKAQGWVSGHDAVEGPQGYFLGSHPLTKELGDQRVPQTLGPTHTHERHVKLGKGVPRERHNKSYTREHGGVKWGGLRATGGGGVQDTHQHNIGTPLLYRYATIYHVTPLMGPHMCMEKWVQMTRSEKWNVNLLTFARLIY